MPVVILLKTFFFFFLSVKFFGLHGGAVGSMVALQQDGQMPAWGLSAWTLQSKNHDC